jgi:beta-glucosidase
VAGWFHVGDRASSTQCEGAAPASDWWEWERQGHAPPSGDGNGFARGYREDFALFAALGLSHNRMSIEWARIEPEEGTYDQTSIAHYREVLGAAHEAGITPWVYYAAAAYRGRGWPPGHNDRAEWAVASESIRLASAEAALRLRQTGAPVSSIFGLSCEVALDDRPETAARAASLRAVNWDAGLGLFRDGVLRIPGGSLWRGPIWSAHST